MSKLPLMSGLGIVFLTWRRQLQRDMLPHRVTLKQHYVLKQLEKYDHLFPSQIADILFCDRPTATVIIKNMEREGWIRRDKDPENGKQTLVTITEQGRYKLNSIDKDVHTIGKHTIDPTECFTEAEKAEFERLLSKLRRYMDEVY